MALETEHKQLEPGTVRPGVATGISDSAKARYFVAIDGDGVRVGPLLLIRAWSDRRNGHWWWHPSVYVVPDSGRRGQVSGLYGQHQLLVRPAAARPGVRLVWRRGPGGGR